MNARCRPSGESASCATEATGDGLNVTPAGGSTSNRTVGTGAVPLDAYRQPNRAPVASATPASAANAPATYIRRHAGCGAAGTDAVRAVSGPPEGSREVGGALPSIVRVLRQALSNDGLGERRRERLKRRHRRRLTLEDRRDQARWRLTLERLSAR